ncbi:MAG: hypothetical protein V4564_03850 [Pseudomonadota bacterium]
MTDQEETHISGQDARAGATPKMTRYILGISLPLVALLLLWR